MKLWRLGSILIGLAVAITACQLKDDSAGSGAPAKPSIPAPADVASPPADAIRLASGVAYKVITVGLGSIRPTERNVVRVHYTGWTTDGKMFESSYGGEPAQFGVTQVVPGWIEMLQLMVVGEKVRVWIPG